MSVFEGDKPEADRSYIPPLETSVQRIETPITAKKLKPPLRKALGSARIAELFEIEIRGGQCTRYCNKTSQQLDGREGIYITTFKDSDGFNNFTNYQLGPDDEVEIIRLRYKVTNGTLQHGDTRNLIADIQRRPYGIGASVTFEPEGTDQPVLRYIEVRPQSSTQRVIYRLPKPPRNLLNGQPFSDPKIIPFRSR